MVGRNVYHQQEISHYSVTYAIKDVSDEEIKGQLYEPELQLVIKEDNVYDVEKVLKTRRRSGKIEYYVKWKGYPTSLILG